VLNAIRIWFVFSIVALSVWYKKKKQHFFAIQSEIKLKPAVARSHSFSRASRQLYVFDSSFDWFTGLPVFILYG